jgi:hypothetical protein
VNPRVAPNAEDRCDNGAAAAGNVDDNLNNDDTAGCIIPSEEVEEKEEVTEHCDCNGGSCDIPVATLKAMKASS